ncbi:MAG: hypothetical protein ACOC44_10830 [Promethearchaeia archaeon]
MTSEKNKDKNESVLRKHPDEMEYEEILQRLYAQEKLYSDVGVTKKKEKNAQERKWFY